MLSAIFGSVRYGLGLWGGERLLDQAVVMLAWGRLGIVLRKLERLAARFAAGTVWTRVARVRVAERVDRPARAAAVRLWPTGFGWLVKTVGWRAGGHGGQLQTVLERPDMVAFLRACPQAGRILSPVCRMLAVPPSVFRPRPEGVVAEVVAPKVVVKRVRKPRVPIDWGRIPLPRGVLTAARRGGFKSGG